MGWRPHTGLLTRGLVLSHLLIQKPATRPGSIFNRRRHCMVNGINSYRYLQALLVALPLAQTADDYEELLPWNIALPTC